MCVNIQAQFSVLRLLVELIHLWACSYSRAVQCLFVFMWWCVFEFVLSGCWSAVIQACERLALWSRALSRSWERLCPAPALLSPAHTHKHLFSLTVLALHWWGSSLYSRNVLLQTVFTRFLVCFTNKAEAEMCMIFFFFFSINSAWW